MNHCECVYEGYDAPLAQGLARFVGQQGPHLASGDVNCSRGVLGWHDGRLA